MKIDERDYKEAFWSRVNKTDLCWNWTGCLSNGYGTFRTQRAHRVAFALSYKGLTKDLLVCHRCDNRACVRPDHLFLGTSSDNARDAYYKGRVKKLNGPKFQKGNIPHNFCNSLSYEQAIEIRKLYSEGVKQVDLAREFKVKRNVIYKIVHNKSYKIQSSRKKLDTASQLN